MSSENDAGLGREAVLGMDSIPLELPLAGLGSRLLAAGIDYFVLAFLWTLALILSLMAVAALKTGIAWGIAILLLVFFLIHWGYFTGFEIGSRGRTPGKMAVGLRVVGREGGTPSVAAFLLRNLLRDIDLLVGALLIALDDRARRLGDRVAGTLVVHDRRPAPELVLGRIPPGWGPREVAVAESLLSRAAELELERARSLAARLLRLIARDAPHLVSAGAAADPIAGLWQALDVTVR